MSSTTTVPCPIHRQARARPDALALWSAEREWTYRALDEAIAATRVRLESGGLRRGGRVAVRMSRRAEYVILVWALWRADMVVVPMSTRWPSQKMGEALRRLGPDVFVREEEQSADLGALPCASLSVDEVVTESGEEKPRPRARPVDRPASIVHTSGTTGEPRAILHSWANHIYSAKGSNANIPLRPGDRWLLSLPLYHVGGLAILVRCALRGAAVAVPSPDAPLHRSLDTAGATHVSVVSTQLRRLLDAVRGSPPDRVRAVLVGGGPVPDSLVEASHERNWPVHTSYGSTEMASQITTTASGASRGDLETAGRVLPHRGLRIDDRGEIWVSGSTLCVGAVQDGEIRDVREDGWYRTGDWGWLDASGRLHVTGRVDRQFVSGGENIQPEEIEGALEGLHGVARAVVVAVPNDEFGRRPVGFVRTEEGGLPADWRTALESVLARYKIPDALYELPEEATEGRLKIDRELVLRKATVLQEQKSNPEAALD